VNQETQDRTESAEYEAPRVEDLDRLQGTALTAAGTDTGSVTTVSQPK
jgi:hypothetical protein